MLSLSSEMRRSAQRLRRVNSKEAGTLGAAGTGATGVVEEAGGGGRTTGLAMMDVDKTSRTPRHIPLLIQKPIREDRTRLTVLERHFKTAGRCILLCWVKLRPYRNEEVDMLPDERFRPRFWPQKPRGRDNRQSPREELAAIITLSSASAGINLGTASAGQTSLFHALASRANLWR